MSDSEPPRNVTRRRFLAGMLSACAAPHLPLSALSGVAAPANGVMSSTFPTLYQFLKYTLINAQGVEKNMDYLQILAIDPNFESVVHLPGIAEEMVSDSLAYDIKGWPQIGQRLLWERPNDQTITKFLSTPEAKQLIADFRLPPYTVSKISDDLRDALRMSPEEMADAIRCEIDTERSLVNHVQELAKDNPEIAERIQQLKTERAMKKSQSAPGMLRDMAAAHNKSGYAPAGKNGVRVSNDEECALKIGLYTPTRVSGCEHYSTITSRDELLRNSYRKHN